MLADPLGLAEDVDAATARLIDTVHRLDDEAVRAPSLLPGWTRGHVLTHIARNADGACNLLTWARTGVETPQYESTARRNADIEAGAGRTLREHAADVAATGERLRAAILEMPPEAWTVVVRWTSGAESPSARVVWSRLREVEVHHVDLDAGYSAAEWPEAFTLRMATSLARDFGDRVDGPRVVIRSPEVGHDLPIGPDVTEPVVSGPAWAAVTWLIGRSDGGGLTVEPAGSLPRVPPLG